ncbi:MAG: bifunctional adenosylcobinamide kinase/adenosylcobinamide-phosphate guanylyltransferase [Sulfuritalea sp.]|nr:bifunctional adenosylcobinamide kinase/adenosylcobinamide-phosphate guanylyltransferase [Sulfuritalea sp.]
MIELILGGERSGKSALAEPRPAESGLAVICIATALVDHAAPDRCLLVECLSLWLANLLHAGAAAKLAEAGEEVNCPLLAFETSALLDCLPQLPGRVILVSNEVGLGIAPPGAATRLYVDDAGRLNWSVARIAQRVTSVAAGLPLELKGG